MATDWTLSSRARGTQESSRSWPPQPRLLANACRATLDDWTNLVSVWSSCFALQQCAKLIAKRLQVANLVVDFS